MKTKKFIISKRKMRIKKEGKEDMEEREDEDLLISG